MQMKDMQIFYCLLDMHADDIYIYIAIENNLDNAFLWEFFCQWILVTLKTTLEGS